MMTEKIKGNIVDAFQKKIYGGEIQISEGKIVSITPIKEEENLPFILPGFVDAHVHIESSMLIPSQFARLAVVHGTVATVSDPHEIANVCGMEGIHYMIQDGKSVPFKFCFGAPSCVPATRFETAGAVISAADIRELFKIPQVGYLSEMMNFPGVLFEDAEVMEKIRIAKEAGKPVDGHAPGLRGKDAQKYISAGITTDHECFTSEEAMDKLSLGMKILIREGSAAKNFEALAPLMSEHWMNLMLCSDDKHPDSLVEGHINNLCERAAKEGVDIFKIVRMSSINPVEHYNLDVGLLRVGDPADFILCTDLKTFQVKATWISGVRVAKDGKSEIAIQPNEHSINNFNAAEIKEDQIRLEGKSGEWSVIEALDGQLITNHLRLPLTIKEGKVVNGIEEDILKLVVVNRYNPSAPAVSLISNFGLKSGAIASTVAHDSHNIIAVGNSDETICRAINLVIKSKGGISATDGVKDDFLPLPIAGLMSNDDGYSVAERYSALDKRAKELGSTLSAPFMTLSFMALLVIPKLKLSDKGLFDGEGFKMLDF